MNLTTNDAQGLEYVRRSSLVLSARSFEQEYDYVNASEFVPVNTDYPEWADGVQFDGYDITGGAQWQSGYAKDVPLADISVTNVTAHFATYSVGYRYNVEEVGKAMFSGVPINPRKAVSARTAADIFVYDTALIGGGHPGWSGLFNYTGVTPQLSPNNGTGSARNWVDANGEGLKTPEQIVAELNKLIMGPTLAVGTVANLLADTILLPPAAMTYIATTPYGVTSPNETILSYFMRNNVYTLRTGGTLTIKEVPYLATAATDVAVTGQGRAVGYRNSRDAMELPMPMPFNFRGVYQDGPLQWTVPGLGRVGQLTLFRDALRYLDAVTPAP